jgi:hypothetical protein
MCKGVGRGEVHRRWNEGQAKRGENQEEVFKEAYTQQNVQSPASLGTHSCLSFATPCPKEKAMTHGRNPKR